MALLSLSHSIPQFKLRFAIQILVFKALHQSLRSYACAVMLSLMHIQKCGEKKEIVYSRLNVPLLETNQCTQLSGAYKQCNRCQHALKNSLLIIGPINLGYNAK